MSDKKDFLYDVRIAEKHLQDGTLSQEEYDKHLASLPDVEEKGEPLVIEENLVDEPEAELEQAQEQEDETE